MKILNFGWSLLLTEKSRGSWKYKLYHKTNKLPHKTDFKLLHKPSKYILIDNYIFTKLQPVSILAVSYRKRRIVLQLAKTSKKLELLFFNIYFTWWLWRTFRLFSGFVFIVWIFFLMHKSETLSFIDVWLPNFFRQ